MRKILIIFLIFLLAFFSLSVKDTFLLLENIINHISKISFEFEIGGQKTKFGLEQNKKNTESQVKNNFLEIIDIYENNVKMQLFVFLFTTGLFLIYNSFESRKRKETKKNFVFLQHTGDLDFQRLWDELDKQGGEGGEDKLSRLQKYGNLVIFQIFLLAFYTIKININNFFLAFIMIALYFFIAILIERHYRFKFIFNNFYSSNIELKIKELNKINLERKYIILLFNVLLFLTIIISSYYIYDDIVFAINRKISWDTPFMRFLYFIGYELVETFAYVKPYQLIVSPTMTIVIFTILFFYGMSAFSSYVYLIISKEQEEKHIDEIIKNKEQIKDRDFFIKENKTRTIKTLTETRIQKLDKQIEKIKMKINNLKELQKKIDSENTIELKKLEKKITKQENKMEKIRKKREIYFNNNEKENRIKKEIVEELENRIAQSQFRLQRE